MSGGNMSYFYSQMEEYCDRLGDRELNELARDLCKLFHDKEWFESGDIGSGSWNKSVADFKAKWFEAPREERILRYINDAANDLKLQFGIVNMCKDCNHFDKRSNSEYSDCPFCKGYMVHGYEKACEHFNEPLEVSE